MAWFTAPSGATCVAAYDAVGAASLADSYTNEAAPGTYTAAPGVAPSWAYGSGWTFNGTTQYLTTGAVHGSGWSMIVRFSGTGAADGYLAGALSSATTRLHIAARRTGVRVYGGGGTVSLSPGQASGVMAVAGAQPYLNGAADGGAMSAWSGTNTQGVMIGCISNSGTPALSGVSNIQALAIYSGTLTLADVVAITAAMQSLPVAAAKGLPVIAHHYRQIFGG